MLFSGLDAEDIFNDRRNWNLQDIQQNVDKQFELNLIRPKKKVAMQQKIQAALVICGLGLRDFNFLRIRKQGKTRK